MNLSIVPRKPEPETASVPFPLVGIGASAGGLEALQRLLPGLPPSPGFAIVVILHLAPDMSSMLDQVLQKCCKMPVVQVTQHPTELEPNTVYVIAPGTLLKVEDRYLFLDQAGNDRSAPGAIDYFFHSLALSHGALAAGVQLSGMGHDGCGGLAALRAQGGTVIVQEPDDAQCSSMPQAAIDAGQADIVLPADEIAARLLVLCGAPPVLSEEDERQALHDVLTLLNDHTGHDFRRYKRPTILRRLEGRMQLQGVSSMADYRSLMARDGDESSKLLKDLLIGVTGFFRDPEAFEQLRQTVLPVLLAARRNGGLRVWVAACSTGQEAYSLAMLLADMVRELPDPPRIHIFASDIDQQALGVARAGLYPEAIRDEVPAASLERYFVRSGKYYRVRQSLRELITFASHNLLRDPPFSGLDLVTCRNLLIYLDRDMQRHVLQRFHFALGRDGYLFLGSAETADVAPQLFERVDRPSRIYRVIPARGRVAFPASLPPHFQANEAAPQLSRQAGISDLHERLAEAENSRQQLQSYNEELSTINAELKVRLEDTGKAHDDLNNLIASVDLATVFVDHALAVKRFTPRAAGIFNLIPRDVGRHLLDLTHRLEYPQLADDVAQTFASLQPLEREVRGTGGRHYIVRVRPYRTADEVIAGAVLTFFDISERRVAEDEARELASDQEFLLQLGDRLRPLIDPLQVLVLGCRMLGERLGVPRLAFATIRGGRYAMLDGYSSGLAPLQGEGELEALGEEVLARWRAGDPVIALADAVGMAGLAALAGGRGAMLASVCRKGPHWLGFFLACQPEPRAWSAAEVALFEETAVRIGVEFERARAQAALLTSETRLRGLLRGFARAYWETDSSGLPFGEDLLQAVHPDDRGAIMKSWRMAVCSGTELDAEVRLRSDKAEGWRLASLLVTPLFDAQGDILKWIGCIIDDAEQAPLPSGSI